jgi:hypothetical protein
VDKAYGYISILSSKIKEYSSIYGFRLFQDYGKGMKLNLRQIFKAKF